jgi:DNA mismatch repair protein MSH4
MSHRGKRQARSFDLQSKVARTGGATGFSLLDNDDDDDEPNKEERSAGLYGHHGGGTVASSIHRTRLFQTTPTTTRTPASRHSQDSRRSRFSRASTLPAMTNQAAAVHIVCAVSENLARETCVASLDAGAPTALQVTKQGNGQTYAETLAYLEVLKPDEILLNEGRRNSPLARKVLELFGTGRVDTANEGGEEEEEEEDRFDGGLANQTVVKFISRSCFDQTRGAELLRKIARDYDAHVAEEYILLSASHAVLNYTQTCLGANFCRNSLVLHIHAGGNHRMSMDRSTLLQLELLVNSKTGKAKHSLIATVDCTKTTVGSRLLRTNLMAPPTRPETINTRLELVEMFLGDADFFYTVLEHLAALPDVDKMLSNIALVPSKQRNKKGSTGALVNQRIASRGISALVCIKSTLTALPSLAGALQLHLQSLERHHPPDQDDASVHTNRSSLWIGLGGGASVSGNSPVQRFHLLRAILFTVTQPALAQILASVSDIFTETTTFSRNANAMRHQECFALKCEETDLMSVIRKAFLSNVDDIYKKADEYAELYGIHVQVRHSATRGYFLAVPAQVGAELPQVFLQPTKSRRFITCTTEEISSLNSRAQDNMHDLLLMTHDRIQLVLQVARENYDAVAALCDAVAILDMCHSFADNVTLSRQTWCRPVVTPYDDTTGSSGAFMVRGGRFSIDVSNVGLSTDDRPAEYIPNDTYAAENKPFTMITGINGSGKSTYLNQIAIIVILAQCGSYVPAEQASIPIRDQLYCRIGNADDQEHNISTFMLEMKETAFICNNATERSLVLVDELGRATSNEDGVAIAWALGEYLLKKRAMTFFVTHYPQLARLSDIYPHRVQNVHMAATVERAPQGGEIHYTHKLQAGACQVSTDYGVELAAACGWPADVFQDASSVLKDVEEQLPDDPLCDDHNGRDPSVANRALRVLGEVHQNLQRLVSGEEMLSLPGIREKMHALQEGILQDGGEGGREALLDSIDRLLFREELHPRRELSQSQKTTTLTPQAQAHSENNHRAFDPEVASTSKHPVMMHDKGRDASTDGTNSSLSSSDSSSDDSSSCSSNSESSDESSK